MQFKKLIFGRIEQFVRITGRADYRLSNGSDLAMVCAPHKRSMQFFKITSSYHLKDLDFHIISLKNCNKWPNNHVTIGFREPGNGCDINWADLSLTVRFVSGERISERLFPN